MGGYVAATGPGEGVLRVRVAITRVGPKLSDSTDSGSTTSKFRTKQFTRGGDVQISGIVDDSSTGKPLARFVDIRDSRSNWGLKNELTNREEAKEMFESWARLFVFRLQESRKRQQQSGKSW